MNPRQDNAEIVEECMLVINEKITDLPNQDYVDVIELIIIELKILKDTFDL